MRLDITLPPKSEKQIDYILKHHKTAHSEVPLSIVIEALIENHYKRLKHYDNKIDALARAIKELKGVDIKSIKHRPEVYQNLKIN